MKRQHLGVLISLCFSDNFVALGRRQSPYNQNMLEKRFVQYAIRFGTSLEFRPRMLERIQIHFH